MRYIVKNNVLSLSALIVLTLILEFLTSHFILTVNFYENSGDPVSGIPGQAEGVFQALQQWIYIAAAAYLVIKISLISLLLYTALYLAEAPVPFKRVFGVVTLAEYLFLIPAVMKVCLFHREYPEGTLADWHRFYLLSAVSFFPSAPADWSFALQTLNVFEIGYWFLLGMGISHVTGLNYDRSLRIVLLSYVPALAAWVALVTFCALLLFPNTG